MTEKELIIRFREIKDIKDKLEKEWALAKKELKQRELLKKDLNKAEKEYIQIEHELRKYFSDNRIYATGVYEDLGWIALTKEGFKFHKHYVD
jgi:thiamine pyrophosphate-dependent acetolactate synthase large subunit-like protein